MQEKHVPAALVATWLAAGDLVVMALEVPTGWLADRFGDRRSMIAGSCAQVVGMLACWLCPGVTSLAAGGLLIAVGDALRSGADQALLYRSCVADGVPAEFQRIEGRTRGVALMALVLLTLAGGALVATAGWSAAWALDTALCALGVVIAAAMRDASGDAPATDSQAEATPLFSARLLAAILPAAVVGAAASAVSFIAQAGSDASPALVTWVVAGIVLAEACGAALGGRTSPLAPALQRGAAVLSVLALAASTHNAVAPAALAVLLSFVAGLFDPWRAVAIQQMASDSLRATAASFASACDMACSTLLLPLAGFMRGRHSRR